MFRLSKSTTLYIFKLVIGIVGVNIMYNFYQILQLQNSLLLKRKDNEAVNKNVR
jgi:cytoskeletal protein RodZ